MPPPPPHTPKKETVSVLCRYTKAVSRSMIMHMMCRATSGFPCSVHHVHFYLHYPSSPPHHRVSMTTQNGQVFLADRRVKGIIFLVYLQNKCKGSVVYRRVPRRNIPEVKFPLPCPSIPSLKTPDSPNSSKMAR